MRNQNLDLARFTDIPISVPKLLVLYLHQNISDLHLLDLINDSDYNLFLDNFQISDQI